MPSPALRRSIILALVVVAIATVREVMLRAYERRLEASLRPEP